MEINKLFNSTPPENIPEWTSIHVFGYGESQITGKKILGKVPNSGLSSIVPLLSAISGGNEGTESMSLEDLHAMNILNNMFIDVHPKSKEKKIVRTMMANVDEQLVANLVNEIKQTLSENKQK